MTENEARTCAALLRERWSEEQLALEIEAPGQENGMRHVLRIFLPKDGRKMRMLYRQQLPAALDRLTEVLGKGRSLEAQRKPFQRRDGTVPTRKAMPRLIVSEPVPPASAGTIRWEHGDACEIAGRGDGPFIVLAVVAQDTLLCQKRGGQFFHCQAHLAQRIVSKRVIFANGSHL